VRARRVIVAVPLAIAGQIDRLARIDGQPDH
jgi:hypothetical protein